jgi:SAM-dependent methyltransferase
VNCLCCNDKNYDGSNLILDYRNTNFVDSEIFNNRQIIICNVCGFGVLIAEPDSIEIQEFYTHKYRSIDSGHYFDFEKSGPLKNIDPRSFAQIQTGIFFVDFATNDNFLDLGPGNGHSFSMASQLLPKPNLFGIEFNQGAERFYKDKYNVKTYGTLPLLIEQNIEFKMVLLSHSLEHFRKEEMIEYISSLKNILSADGICIVEVPNDDFRVEKSRSRINDAPHLLFFSLNSIKMLFENHGFEVIYSKIVGVEKFPTRRNSLKKNSFQLINLVTIKNFFIRNIIVKKLRIVVESRIARYRELNYYGYSDNILTQFIAAENKDCIRLVIRKLG